VKTNRIIKRLFLLVAGVFILAHVGINLVHRGFEGRNKTWHSGKEEPVRYALVLGSQLTMVAVAVHELLKDLR